MTGSIVSQISKRMRRWSAWFFQGRYLLLARLLGMGTPVPDQTRRGTVFIEIDGLGHDHLCLALHRGSMPFVRSLLRRGHSHIYRWRCGLAADTPAAQSALLYGTNEGIVGFYWFDRHRQQRVVGANPNDMRREERRLAATRQGLLAGGSSYACIISGGADWNVLTIAGTSPHWFRPGQALLRTLIILLLNPGKVLRFIFDAAWEMLQEWEERLRGLLAGTQSLHLDAFPLIRVLLNVLPREIAATGTRLDMLRGVSVIYACLIGYDIVGHRNGPTATSALRALRGLDGAIQKIFETRLWCRRRYDIVILSDHGMTPCQPFAQAFGENLEQWVARWWEAKSRYPSPSQAQQVAGRVAAQGTGWLNTWGRVGAMFLELGSGGAIKLGERFFVDPEEAEARPQVMVIPCGSLAQIWVRGFERRLLRSQIEQLAPGFLTALAAHPGAALVVVRDESAITVLSREGTLRLRLPPDGPAGAAMIWQAPTKDLIAGRHGVNPLERYEEPDVVLRQIISFARMDACGDVICLADVWRPNGDATSELHTYAFEQQAGCHAAAGGDQAYPFLLLPAHIQFDPETVGEATHLHRLFAQIVHGEARQGRGQTPPATSTAAAPMQLTAVSHQPAAVGQPEGDSASPSSSGM